MHVAHARSHGLGADARLRIPLERDRSLRESPQCWLVRQEKRRCRHWSRWSSSLRRCHEALNQSGWIKRYYRKGSVQDFWLWIGNRIKLLRYRAPRRYGHRGRREYQKSGHCFSFEVAPCQASLLNAGWRRHPGRHQRLQEQKIGDCLRWMINCWVTTYYKPPKWDKSTRNEVMLHQKEPLSAT